MTEPIFDQEKLDVYRLLIDYVAASYQTAWACRERIDAFVIKGFARLNPSR